MARPTFSINGLLDQIRAQPIMYLGIRSITRLYMYEAGYTGALYDHGIVEPSNGFAPGIHFWVRARLGLDRSSIGWLGSILEVCDNDEERAFERFYELLDEYRSGQFSNIVAEWEAEWDAKWAGQEEQEAQNEQRET